MAIRGLIWPLRATDTGDFETGDLTVLAKSDIRTVLQTSRYVNPSMPGERRMRPGAYNRIPNVLFAPVPKDALQSGLVIYVREALSILSDRYEFPLVSILTPTAGGYRVKIGYRIRGENEIQFVTIELDTQTIPSGAEALVRQSS